jgi:hypothetical protein
MSMYESSAMLARDGKWDSNLRKRRWKALLYEQLTVVRYDPTLWNMAPFEFSQKQ